MTISFNGIKQFLTTELSANEIAEILTDIGLEVEGLTEFESIKGALEGIVVGEVLTVTQHPNADKLKICQVNLGNETKQIVCGASNVASGQKVPVAIVGTELYTESGEKFTIKIGKLRGEESHGMICAEDEIGLGKNHDGILVLEPNIEAGTLLKDIFHIEKDIIFEIGLTPNRADAMSHYGVARDLYAALKQRKHTASFKKIEINDTHFSKKESSFSVEIEDKQQCPRYTGILIENVTIKESPEWLKNRIKAIDLNPINNVVDATNYILHYYGQPLHSFDADKISSKKIHIGNCIEGSLFTTLDNVERKLSSTDLMIKEGPEKPICIAGVFGGLYSGVTSNTKNIFLESAYFNPVAVRKTAKNHALNTDASFRFERGIDSQLTLTILKIAADLICNVSGGVLNENFIDSFLLKIEDFEVKVRFDKINQILGQGIEVEEIKTILQSLEIEILSESKNELNIKIPSYRNDVTREIDVIEEILRIYGYNHIEIPEKIEFTYKKVEANISLNQENNISNLLKNNGFFEVMNNSLVEKTNEIHRVELLNPLSNDLAILRTTMQNTILQNIAYNTNRKQQNIKFFEFGNIYSKENEYKEKKILALAISGNIHENNWFSTDNKASFYHLKGIVKIILQTFGFQGYDEIALQNEEGISIQIQNKTIASISKISKEKLKKYDVSQDVFYAELYWNECINLIKNTNIKITEIPKFPVVKRDLALLLNKEISYASLYKKAFETDRKLLKKVALFDVYEGKNLAEGKKSYALSFELQDENKTLTDKEIDTVMQKLIKQFSEHFSAELRN